MDTGVEHGRQPDTGEPAASATGSPDDAVTGPGPAEHAPGPTTQALPALTYDDDAPTMILDLRAAFAEAGPPGAAPLGIVESTPERPVRAAIAFLAVLALIAGVAGGVVVAVASAGRAVYASVFGPAQCSAAQVADGATLENWLRGVLDSAAAQDVEVLRTGCVTVDVLDPLTGQAASATVAAGGVAKKVEGALKETVDCTFGAASSTGAKFCTVNIGTRLGVVSYRPAADKKTVEISVNYR
jgi:hypothetical protein